MLWMTSPQGCCLWLLHNTVMLSMTHPQWCCQSPAQSCRDRPGPGQPVPHCNSCRSSSPGTAWWTGKQQASELWLASYISAHGGYIISYSKVAQHDSFLFFLSPLLKIPLNASNGPPVGFECTLEEEVKRKQNPVTASATSTHLTDPPVLPWHWLCNNTLTPTKRQGYIKMLLCTTLSYGDHRQPR